ncbi:MAG: Asparaginyl-tRNA synthetase, partial [uncultured Gemmatimonadetes bacterium]
ATHLDRRSSRGQGGARHRRPRAGVDPHPARFQGRDLVPERARRVVLRAHPGGGGRGPGELRGRGHPPHGRVLGERVGGAGAHAGTPATRGDPCHGGGGGRVGGGPGDVPHPAQSALDGVPAHGRAPPSAHQHLWRGGPGAAHAVDGGAPLLRPERLLLGPHAHHHHQRRRGGGGDVPRLHPGPGQPAAHRRRRRGLLAGLLRALGRAHRLRPAQRGGVLRGALQGVHLRPHLPRGELQHEPAPGRVLDDRAGDRLRGPERGRGPGRGVPQVDLHRPAERAPGRHGVLRGAGGQGGDPPPGALRRELVRADGLHRGRAAPGGIEEEVRVPRALGRGPAERARAVPHRGAGEAPRRGDELPEGDQVVLHARERGRPHRGRHGRPGARDRRDHRRVAARGAAGGAGPAHGGDGAGEGIVLVVPRPAPLRHGAARGFRAGLRAPGPVLHRHRQHPGRHSVPAGAGERGLL